MASGKYNKRVRIQSTEQAGGITEDAFGGEIQTFTDVETAGSGSAVWAEVEYGSGAERRVGAAQEQANLPVMVKVRHSSITKNIRPGSHQLQFDGKTWDIESAAPDDGNPRDLMIIARARIT